MADRTDQEQDFFQRVQEHYDSLSITNRRIADYTTAHFDEVIFLSAAELAAELDTSEAAVVRFAQSLGYSGYPDLKRVLVRHYRDQITPARKVERYLKTVTADYHFYSQVIESEIESLRESIATVDGEPFKKAVSAICNAEHRYVYASGVNAGLANYMSFRLNRFRLRTTAETDSGKYVFERFAQLQPTDVVINYSFYQPAPEHLALMDFVKRRGIPNVLITDTNVPPMVRNAELVLYGRRGPFGVFHSLIVPMAISNALILAVAERLGSQAIAALQELSDIRRDYSHAGVEALSSLGEIDFGTK